MELILQGDLPHQTRPVKAIADVFKNVPIENAEFYSNPKFDFSTSAVRYNIMAVKANPDNNVPAANRAGVSLETPLGLDIRMETGTGKTYVYTRAIFELHRRYGISKFILIVPTLPIKAGAEAFLTEMYVSQHFADTLGYDARIDLSVVTPMKTKKGKRFFPSSVRSFIGGNAPDKIQVLLVNQGLLAGSAKVLSRSDYDTGVLDCFRPFDVLKSTRPFVIIDEPHKFDKSHTTYKTVVGELAPQCIIRFGATFPKRAQGRGKKKVEVEDYANLVFNLTAGDAFNQNLIKGVIKEHLEIPDVSDEKIKVISTLKGKTATLRHTKLRTSTSHVFAVGDSLSILSSGLGGISLTGIGKDFIVLSNSQEKRVGEEFSVDAYSESYQEQMLRLALKRHFEVERENFDRPIRIKTLALFFIDSIRSFRGEKGEGGWLRDMFERLLSEQIEVELSQSCSDGYAAYLRATKDNIPAAIAGYFAQDITENEDSIANEVNAILHKKKELLSFEGGLGTCRFLFSKWTLREGWDNPNVFTIAKLRSSGSEISKLQEVGRGLRLPVDELGNRISNEQFMLNYIIDFTEKDFASKLVAEINGQCNEPVTSIPQPVLASAAVIRGCNEFDLLIELYQKGYITDTDRTINPSKLFDLYAEYPELNTSGIPSGKVKDRNAKEPKSIRIRPARYAELRNLWEELNRHYIIYFDREVDRLVEEALPGILDNGVFSIQVIESKREQLGIVDGEAVVMGEAGTQQLFHSKRIPYRDFLRRANRATSVPVPVLHNAIARYSELADFSNDFINESSLTRFVNKFNEWRADNLQGRFNYRRASAVATKSTALTFADGSPRQVIAQGRVGVHMDNGIVPEKFLYDTIVYDSPLERENVLANISEVVVYGKIPRKSISIPTIADSSFSPDFMYVVKKANGEHELNVVIETKAVDNETDLRGNEKIKISCAERFFKQLKADGYTVHFRKQLKHEAMKTIIHEILNS